MNATADVIVVGGGVIGSAVAYELSRRSVKVLLLDQSLPGRASSASAGGLWPVGESVGLGCGVIYHHAASESLNKNSAHPEILPEGFRDLLVRSNACFPELAEALRAYSGVDIEYELGCGLLFVLFQEAEWEFVRHVEVALGTEYSIDLLTSAEARAVEPQLAPDLLGAVRIEGEHQVNPMAFTEALKRSAVRLGAHFRHGARVTRIIREGKRILGVELHNEQLHCAMVVNAAGAWAGRLATTASIDIPVVPVRGQVVLTEMLPSMLRTCISTAECYLAQKHHGEILIGSTTERAGFDTSVTTEAISRLCRGAVHVVPGLGQVGIKRVWAGLRPGTPDELPILGPVGDIEGYVNAAGGFRTGIVAAPMTARIVAACVTGEELPLSIEPFLAERFSMSRASR